MASEKEYQAKPRNKATPAVYLILYSQDIATGGEILLSLRKNTGYQDGKWELPAGHIDTGELPTEAMVREAKEEVGIDLKRDDLKLVHTSYRPTHDKTGDRVDFVFWADQWVGEPRICEPDKCEKLEWVRLNQLPNHIVPHVRLFIESWRRGKRFSELDLEWLKDHGLYKLSQ